MTNNLNITIASDPQEELMQKNNKKILKNKLKNDVINFEELEQSYKESESYNLAKSISDKYQIPFLYR